MTTTFATLAKAELTETARTQMHRSIWSYLNRLLPSTCTDADIDAATEAFVAAGLDATVTVYTATARTGEGVG